MPAATASGRRSASSLANFEPFSEDHEFLSTTLIGESEILKLDTEGRVVLTDTIKDYAGLGERVTFVGQGYKFQIWEPERFAAVPGRGQEPACATFARTLGGRPARSAAPAGSGQ